MSEAPSELTAAYAVCRRIARREAKNFYYAFRVLPQHKADAMCAVYAFMRKADDLADEETLSLEARRAAMEQWTAAWKGSRVEETSDPIFAALNDTQQRFDIGDELLEQLVRGTTLDLQEKMPGVVGVAAGERSYQVYETFEDLYRYCYLVASVVGLVCIRIFGYSDERAEKFAEHVGIAFQLTNILRDVREDAERGRIYLPLVDMAAAHVELEDFILATRGAVVQPAMIDLLRTEIRRAGIYYHDADALIPLLEADSRPAMRVLTSIYSELLERISADPARVFRQRISVPTSKKVAILAKGVVDVLRARGKT
jgi:phytoene synthase